MFGLLNSASAISAAFFIDCAASPALPAADRGRISATLVPPVPTVWAACGGPGGGSGLLPPNLNRSPPGNPEHAATRMADAAAPAIRRTLTAERTRPASGNTSTLPDDGTHRRQRPVHPAIMWGKPSGVKNLCPAKRMTTSAG